MWDLKTLTLSIPEGKKVNKQNYEVKQASIAFYSKGKMVINVIAPRAATSGAIVKDIFEEQTLGTLCSATQKSDTFQIHVVLKCPRVFGKCPGKSTGVFISGILPVGLVTTWVFHDDSETVMSADIPISKPAQPKREPRFFVAQRQATGATGIREGGDLGGIAGPWGSWEAAFLEFLSNFDD
jgi:hypothetical protein